MRRIRFALSCLWLMTAFSCTQKLNEPEAEKGTEGEIEVVLSHDSSPQTKGASEFTVPEIGALKVEIFKMTSSSPMCLYRDTYDNTLGRRIPLNCADYRLLASYGDSLGTGFDKAYFAGMTDFTLSPQESQVVETLVKVSNVRASVVYGENLQSDYSEYYSVVKSVTKGGKKKSLKFYQDETRSGFVPVGQISLELYAVIDGQWKYYCTDPIQAKPGDDIVFNVEAAKLDAKVGFNVTVSRPDELPITFELTSDLYPADSPTVDENGFGGTLVVTEGDEPQEDLKLDIVADGKIEKCLLSIDSDYLMAQGIPSEIDLADPQMSQSLKDKLQSFGVRWMGDMKGRKYAYVDFSGVSRHLSSVQCDPSNMFEATFSVALVDSRHGVEGSSHVGAVESGSMTFIQGVPSPEIAVIGFENGPVKVMEAVDTESSPLKAYVHAKGRIAKCVLSIDSPYLQAAGLPQFVDLTSVDYSMEQLLHSVGIFWSHNMKGALSAEVDFTGVADYMEGSMYKAANGHDFAGFSIEVENEVYRNGNIKDCASSVGQFSYVLPSSPSATGNYADIDVRARRMDNYSTVLAEGNFNEWALQYTSDGKTWKDMASTLSGSKLTCQQITGLATTASAGVTHNVRAIYHGNPDITYPLSSFTTEAAAQVPNAGFDIWQTPDFEYYIENVKIWGSDGYYTTKKWYLPWTNTSNRCWDVNSRKTMPSTTTPEYQEFKVFPAVSYSVDTPTGTGYSAQMVGVYVCNMATDLTDGGGIGGTLGGLIGGVTQVMSSAAGEIFIGTADGAGNHATEGCSFSSRPDKLRFQYKYSSKNSEKCTVTAWLKDADENIIAEAYTESGAASSWTQTELTWQYHDLDVKPAAIYIAFRSASCDDADVYHDRNVTIEVAGSNQKGHLGSVLKVDNVELIYQ